MSPGWVSLFPSLWLLYPTLVVALVIRLPRRRCTANSGSALRVGVRATSFSLCVPSVPSLPSSPHGPHFGTSPALRPGDAGRGGRAGAARHLLHAGGPGAEKVQGVVPEHVRGEPAAGHLGVQLHTARAPALHGDLHVLFAAVIAERAGVPGSGCSARRGVSGRPLAPFHRLRHWRSQQAS
eukprot:ctg_2208.g489